MKKEVFKLIGGIVTILSLILACNPLMAQASSIEAPAAEIKDGGSVTVKVNGETEEFIKFTAPTAGKYTFESSSSAELDPELKVYTYDEEAGEYVHYTTESDISDGNYQFRYTYEAKKGETIYLGVSLYNKDTSGDVTVKCTGKYDISRLEYVIYNYRDSTFAPFTKDSFIKFKDSKVTYNVYYGEDYDSEVEGVPSDEGVYYIYIWYR